MFLLAGWAAPAAISQDTASPGSRNSHPVISAISIAEHADSVDVEVKFSKLVQPEVSRLEHPDRLVFDFPGCGLAGADQRFAVKIGPALAVSTSALGVASPVARVVIELRSVQSRELAIAVNKLVVNLSSIGNNLIIQLGENRGAQSSALPSGENNPTANSQPLAPKSAEVVPPMPSVPPHVLGSNRATPKSVAAVPPTPTIPPPPQIARTATVQPNAYALLDQARALTVSGLEPLEAKAQAGDPESETTLALAYHAGTLLKGNDAEALRLLQRAANRGFVAAEEAMAIFCQSGFGMPPDKTQALSWYTKAAEHGSRDAATNLALMYSTGDGVPKDATKAATWFHNAAEAGDATAQLNLAALYHRGEGTPQDDAQATLWLTKAADKGLIPAMLELARWDLRAEHGGNVDAAIVWLRKAAELGDATAQVELGDIFVDKNFGRLDYSQAVIWYRKAADQNQPGGQFGLGARYLLGQGLSQDMGEARRWLTPAANRGHPYAQFLLANMFESGEGGPVDAASAAKYYEPAANYGIAEAQYRLGLLLASDRNHGTSLVSAYKWLVLAQVSVKESATTAQELRKLLTPPQIARAEQEIDEWRIAHPLRQPSR
jgi:TPR repeat protein